jgi:transposase, IS5 family
LGIEFRGKKLGRPSKDQAMSNHVRPGERNPIEGKFGQAKLAYGMDRIRAKVQNTSESWISSIVLVHNLVRLMRLASSCLSKLIIRYFAQFEINIKMEHSV